MVAALALKVTILYQLYQLAKLKYKTLPSEYN